MSNPIAPPNANAAWNVVQSMGWELQRQLREGGLASFDSMDSNGRVRLAGTLDLAALAYITELALRREFPSIDKVTG